MTSGRQVGWTAELLERETDGEMFDVGHRINSVGMARVARWVVGGSECFRRETGGRACYAWVRGRSTRGREGLGPVRGLRRTSERRRATDDPDVPSRGADG